MSEDSDCYTCEICGEGQLSEIAMQTHMYTAHVYGEVACMFCDLRGITAEEMTLHINSVHCSDHSQDEFVGHSGSRQHLNGVQHDVRDDTEKQITNQIQAPRWPAKSDLTLMHYDCEVFVDLVDSNSVTDRTGLPHFSNRSSNCNAEKDTRSAGNACKVNRDNQQKRKHSDTVTASSSYPGHEQTDLPPVYLNSFSDTDTTTNCHTSLHQGSASRSQRLPKTALADHIDQTFQGGRYIYV